MSAAPVRYRSADEDSARWSGFPFRNGDIVISTRSKSGTTWMQMICALLIFQTPRLPAPLGDLSPWLDRLTVPREELSPGWPPSRSDGSSRHTRRWTASRSTRALPTDQLDSRGDHPERVIGPAGILKSSAAFFRRGTSGAGREQLSEAELADYRRRAAQLAPPDLAAPGRPRRPVTVLSQGVRGGVAGPAVWQSRRHGD